MAPHTRQAALDRWQAFLPRAAAYGNRRGHVVPGHPNVSQLSPALRHRLVTEEELLASLLSSHPLAEIEKLAQQLLWRPYWKLWLEQHPSVWRHYRTRVAALQPAASRRLQAITSAHSGVAIMDHFVRELLETGWLHNHARLWFAGWWVHTERLPWELGAAFFEHHLLDADPAANTLSWRWVAGLHTRGKSYLVRRSNLEACLDPELLAQHAAGLELLDDTLAQPCPVPKEPAFPLEPAPAAAATPHALPENWGLWVHGDDLAIETHLPLANHQPRAVGAALCRPEGLSQARWDHLRACLLDGLTRAGTHFQCPAHAESGCDLASTLATWATQHALDSVITLRPNVGPLGDELPLVEKALHDRGITLVTLRRPFDTTLLPFAQTGFFGFYQKARSALGLAAVNAP